MRKLINLIALAALMFVPAVAGATTDSVTVANGTTTNGYIPIYGYYADAVQHNQIIYPADSLTAIADNNITGMTFYMASTASSSWGITATISLGIIEGTTLSGINSSVELTQVWQGPVSGMNAILDIAFDEAFAYTEGNLLVDVQTTSGSYISASFYGVEMNGASYCTYSTFGSLVQNFLPKTKFTYSDQPVCRKPKHLVFSDVTNDGFTISWTSNPSDNFESYSVWIDGVEVDTPTDTFYTATGLDANTLYSVEVRTICGEGDTSGSLTGSKRTLCQNGNCEITLQVSTYSYAGSVSVIQNGASIANVSFDYSSGNSRNVEICNGDSLFMIYTQPSYSYSTTTWTVIDAGDSPITTFDNSTATGDTVLAVANGCPSCMPVTDLHVSEADTDYFTVSWVGPANAMGYIVYLDSVEATDYDGTSTEYTVSGLTNSDRHVIWVRVDCGDEDSSAWRIVNASATCTRSHISADDEAEFVETLVGLDGTFGGTVNASADHAAGNALLPCWYFSNNYVWLKNQEITFEGSHPESYLCLPVMDAPINTLEITWTGKIGNIGDTPDSVVLGVADFSGENVVWLDTIFYSQQSRASWVQHPWYALDQYGYEGDGVRIAFKVLFSSNWNAFKNFHVRQIPQCTAPTVLTGHNYINNDSTWFSWTPQGSAEEWQVAVSAPGEDPDGLTLTTVTEPSYVIPEGTLTLGEEYTFWLRANCGEVQSEWVSHTFYSGTVIMPSSGTDTVSGCNLVIYDNGYNGPYPSNYHSSTVVVRPSQPGQLVGISSGWFRNYCYDGSCQGSFTIYDGEGTSGTVLLSLSSHSTITDTILGEEGAITIRLEGGTYAGDGCEIYTFCTDAPTCFRPKHLAVSNVEGTSATLTWDNANATDYIIYYRVDTAEAEWQSLTASSIVDSTFTFDEGTLEASTNYVVKVAGDCGDGDLSLTSTEVRFRTGCANESCQVNVSFTYSYYACTYELIQNGYSFGSTDDEATYDVCSGLPLTLHTTAYSYGDSYEIVLSNIANIELFRGGITQSYDTVINQPCPSCLPATNIRVDSVNATGGTISWNAMGSNTDWAVYVNGEQVGGVVSDTTYTFTGLTDNTVYTIGLRALCDDEDTSVMRSIEMRTACAGGNCEFTLEMTDSYGDGWNGNAIEVYQNGSLYGSYTISSGSSNTVTVTPCLGDSIALLWHTGNYPYETSFVIKDAADSVLLSSGLMSGASTGDSIMVFDGLCNATVIMSSTEPGTDCAAPTGLTVTATTDSTVTISFTGVSGYIDGYEAEIQEGTTWAGGMGEEEDVTGTTHTFTGLTPGTDYVIGVRTVCDSWDYEYSSWVTITVTTTNTEPMECYAPTGLSTVNIDSTRATLTWTPGGEESQWQIKVNTDTNYILANSSTYTLNNLTPATEYKVRVRAYCGADNQSGWSAELTFTTAASQHDTNSIVLADGMNVNLYPNPATSKLTVEAAEMVEVSIVDLNGREVYRSDIAATEHRIDVSALAKGAYFVRLTGSDNTAVRKLIVR